MNRIVLDSIIVDNNLVTYRFHTNEELDSFFTCKELFIQYEESLSDVPFSILTIPFVNILSGFSWLSDSLLFVDAIDQTYYDSNKQLKRAYEELHRCRLKGMLVPSRIEKNTYNLPNDKSFLLFGGGVDCHTSFLRNQETISEIVNIYGWLKDIDEVNDVDLSDKATTEAFATRMGVKATHIRSNFASFFNLNAVDMVFSSPIIKTSFWYGFLHPMAFLSITAPYAWKSQVPRLIIASSFTKDRLDLHCGSFIATDSAFRFAEQGFTLHDGFELNRQDKIKLLVDYQRNTNVSYPIQACSFNDHNCCVCEKCFRTIVELVAENVNPRDYGFIDINGSLKEHWQAIVNRDVSQWGVIKEGYYYYHFAKQRMLENYSLLAGENKDFVDWFLSFDFEGAKRAGLKRYYRKNFFSILKRKLHLA